MAEPRPGPSGPAPTPIPGAPADPSMEDILASIRRILSEDEAGAAPPSPEPAAAASGTGTDEPLELTEEMLVSAPAEPPAPVPEPAPPATLAAPTPAPADPDPPPPAPMPAEERALLAPAAAAAAAASVSTLLRAVAADRSSPVHRGGPTSIEDVVREELRPLLKEWLDQHLPPLVERLVRAEIERVVGRALS